MPPIERAPDRDRSDRFRETPTLREDELVAQPIREIDPERVGRFAVSRKLGEGGVGVVYEAYDTELDRKLAIKLLNGRSLVGSQGRPRLLREAKTMARLSHPNVITVYDVGEWEEQVFIAMEFVDGDTAKGWLDAGPRSWRRILQVFMEAGEGLAAAHEAGIIHRDFKPENVLIGKDGRVRVVDFGLARAVDTELLEQPVSTSEIDGDRLTLTGAVMGTPAYMAAEQFLGTQTDHRTDQFSFCVTLWEALFCERPFRAGSFHELALKVTRGWISEPPADHPVPEWLRAVLRRGLSADPAERHRDMRSLLDTLARLQGDRGEAAAPEAPPELHREDVARVIGRRYRVLGRSHQRSRSLRAHDGLSGRDVEIELSRLDTGVTIADWESSSRRRFLAAISKLSNLQHPHLSAIFDYGFVDGQPYFVTETRDGAVSLAEAGRGQPLSIQLSYLAQLLQGVAYLHRRGILNLRLDPDAVYVIDGKVKIAAHGFCVVGDLHGADADTLAYAAPEVLLGETAGEAADLYAVGVFAFEVLVGRRPFGPGDPSGVDQKLADAVQISTSELDPALAAVVQRLLRRDPGERFESATEVIRALSAAAPSPLSVETVETRESFLRAARFVGRDVEVDRLEKALCAAVEGRGAVWLAGGESGVGKSRLLEELRMLALAREAVVLRGHARTEGGQPYELWREVVRWLMMTGEPDSVDAAVLAALVPDASTLLGHPIAPAPELDAKNSRARLQGAIEAALERSRAPVVILLDDLQWARSESLELLSALCSTIVSLPVLIVGSFRDDEAPELPDQLPAAELLSLARLDSRAIAQLARSMIGGAASHPELLALLERETEGNAFFLVEVVRALGEEAGELEEIAGMELPRSVIAGGVRKVVGRRLDRVQPWARPLLEVAAVGGRAIDPHLLEELADVDVERWVGHCIDVAVLERAEDELRFAHDKLRELVLSRLSSERRIELHRAVAHALEAREGREAATSHLLAHHFGRARMPEREGIYVAIAAEHALESGSYREASEAFARALELREVCAFESTRLVRWRRMSGETHYVLGDLGLAVQTLGEALAEAGFSLPRGRVGWLFLLLRLVFVQALFFLLPGRFVARDPKRRAILREASNAAGRLANLSTYSGDKLRVLAGSLLSANLGQRADHTQGYSFAVMGYSAAYMGMRRLAERYFARAIQAVTEQGDVQGTVEVLHMEAVYLLGEGRFEDCEAALERADAAASRARFALGLALGAGFRAQIAYFRGEFEVMHTLFRRGHDLLGMPSAEHEHSFAAGEGLALAMLGRFDECRRVHEERLTGAQYLLGKALVGSTEAMIHAWEGKLDEAVAAADDTLEHIRRHAIAIPPATPQVYVGPAEAYLAAWAAGDPRPELIAAAQHLSKEVAAWSARYRVGRSQSALLRGHMHDLQGRRRDAIAAWDEAIGWAQRLDLPFFQASAEMALGRAKGCDAGEGRAHLLRAHELFEGCGADHHLSLTRASLGWNDDAPR